MKDWIPLLQSLIWPVFIALIVCRFRTPIRRFLDTVNNRVEQGDGFEYEGPGPVIRLLSSSSQSPSGPEPQPGAQPLLDTAPVPVESQPSPIGTEAAPQVFVAHTSRRDKSLDRGSYRYHRIRIFLEGGDGDLDRVAKVIYHLHPTFYKPDRTITDRATNFELNTSAWGMFNLTADVYVEGWQKPLVLERYLNF